jgi:hypothetical protein
MKFLSLFLVCSFFTFTAQAANCPANTKQLKNCLSTPVAGDNDVAAQTFDSIAICQKGKAFGLAFEKNGEQEVSDVKVTLRAGATSYTANAGDVAFSLETIVNGKKANNAKLTINFKAAKLVTASTYSCQ